MTRTIVMIHGMFCGGWIWENYEAFFSARGYRCVTPTLRYHDVAPEDPPDPRLGTTSILDYAADLEDQIRRLDERPILMGHSMGGLLAQILGSRGLASSLVLLSPAAPAGIIVFKPSALRTFSRLLRTWGFWKKPVRLHFDDTVSTLFNCVPAEKRREIFDRYVHESGHAIREIAFWVLDPEGASKVDARKVACPVLAVAGTKDNITPPSMVRAVARKYRSVSAYKEFEDHGHWVLGEPGWERIAQYVADQLNGGSAGSVSHG